MDTACNIITERPLNVGQHGQHVTKGRFWANAGLGQPPPPHTQSWAQTVARLIVLPWNAPQPGCRNSCVNITKIDPGNHL